MLSSGLDDPADPADVGMSGPALARLADLVQGYVDAGRYAGAVCVVCRRDRVVHVGVHGQHDAERHRPMRPDTIFRIYSMTKPVASVALMTLYERGMFQLTDPVGEYLPELADLTVFARGTADDHDVRPPARPVTVRDLLTHTSGMVAPFTRSPVGDLYRRHRIGRTDAGRTLAGMVADLGRVPLQTDPGSAWIYGVSTDVVGRLCEVVDGRPFDRFLAETVFGPLGMADTGFGVRPSDVDRFAAAYTASAAGTLELSDDPSTSPYLGPQTYFSGSAGLVSTAPDYLRFARMLARGGTLDGERILGPRTLRLMTVNHLPDGRDLTSMALHGGESQREGHGFGLGFGVLLNQAVAQTVGTAGEFFWGGAASTMFLVSPREDLIVLFLTQLRPSSSYPIRRQLRAVVYAAINE